MPIQTVPYVKKFPQIPVLKNYNCKPNEAFWGNFPKNEKQSIYTPIDIQKLEEEISSASKHWSKFQIFIAKKAMANLKLGTKTTFKNKFSPVNCKMQSQQ
jgi:hypothetical protein